MGNFPCLWRPHPGPSPAFSGNPVVPGSMAANAAPAFSWFATLSVIPSAVFDNALRMENSFSPTYLASSALV